MRQIENNWRGLILNLSAEFFDAIRPDPADQPQYDPRTVFFSFNSEHSDARCSQLNEWRKQFQGPMKATTGIGLRLKALRAHVILARPSLLAHRKGDGFEELTDGDPHVCNGDGFGRPSKAVCRISTRRVLKLTRLANDHQQGQQTMRLSMANHSGKARKMQDTSGIIEFPPGSGSAALGSD